MAGNKNDSIILDFFSGSAATGQAVMQCNSEDDGSRKFIMVQLPDKCDKRSEAYKAGYQLFFSVQPFADVVGNYTCQNREKK